MPFLGLPPVRVASRIGAGLLRLLDAPLGRDAEEILAVFDALPDTEARRAILRTLRSGVDWQGQVITMLDRAYLAEGVPTLIVWGRHDAIIPLGHGRLAHAAIPGSILEIFDEAGHFPHHTDPARFVRLVHDFVERTTPAEFDRDDWRIRLRRGRRTTGVVERQDGRRDRFAGRGRRQGRVDAGGADAGTGAQRPVRARARRASVPSRPSLIVPVMEHAGHEEALHGGVANRGRVVRVGPHVLRPSSASSPSVLAFLRDVRAAGFDGVPRPVGIDADGRAARVHRGRWADGPLPQLGVDGRGIDVGGGAHGALRPRIGRLRPGPAGIDLERRIADPSGGPIVCHNDVCLENVVFRDVSCTARLRLLRARPPGLRPGAVRPHVRADRRRRERGPARLGPPGPPGPAPPAVRQLRPRPVGTARPVGDPRRRHGAQRGIRQASCGCRRAGVRPDVGVDGRSGALGPAQALVGLGATAFARSLD